MSKTRRLRRSTANKRASLLLLGWQQDEYGGWYHEKYGYADSVHLAWRKYRERREFELHRCEFPPEIRRG
jgi:hypothetical protein